MGAKKLEAGMNTKGNQRSRETKNKIKGSFLGLVKEKEVSEITVTEICRGADIHRTTFYDHYEDVNALLNEMVQEMYEQIVDFFVNCDWENGENGFVKLFTMIRGQKDFFRQYFEHFSHYLNEKDQLPAILIRNIGSVMNRMGYEDEEELRYHQTFFCCGLIGMIRRWLVRDCKETPEEMGRIIDMEYHTDTDIFFRGGGKYNRP